MSVNRVTLVGHLGQDPELRDAGGTAVCNLSIATTEKWKNKAGEAQEKTEWHRVNVWERQAENCAKYLTKGSLVYVEGKIETRTYEKDGEKRFITEIRANTVQFLSGAKDRGGQHETPRGRDSGGRDGGRRQPADDYRPDDEIPF